MPSFQITCDLRGTAHQTQLTKIKMKNMTIENKMSSRVGEPADGGMMSIWDIRTLECIRDRSEPLPQSDDLLDLIREGCFVPIDYKWYTSVSVRFGGFDLLKPQELEDPLLFLSAISIEEHWAGCCFELAANRLSS